MEEELDRDDPGIPEPQVKNMGFLLKTSTNATKNRSIL